MTRLIIAATVAASFALPSIAQTTEFYVVQDSSTKKCTIVDKKPTTTTTTTTTVLGNTVYKTRTEAENGMKTIKECS